MARGKAKRAVADFDFDGLNIAVEKLADVAPHALADVLETAYAYLLIHYPDRSELARLGLVSEGAAARAARMLIAKAWADGEAQAKRDEQRAKLRGRGAS